MAAELEVYIRDARADEIAAWLSGWLGPLVSPGAEHRPRTYRACREGRAVPVVITESVEGGPFTGVWVNARHLPWETDTEFARAAFARFGGVVRCDPGRRGARPENPLAWWEVNSAGEGLIVWTQPQ
jgi:hypothetical protein